MRTRVVVSVLALGILLAFNSCKDDPAPIAGLTFSVESETTTESDGTVKSFHPLLWQSYASQAGATGTATGREFNVKLVLDKPAPETAVVSYSLSGTALKNSASKIGDYSVEGTNITIDKGATEVNIPLTLYEDFDFFEFEDTDDLFKTIIITLGNVVSGPVSVDPEHNVYTLTINEDDLMAVLLWNTAGSAGTALTADMDMFLWAGTKFSYLSSTQPYTAAEYNSKVGAEILNIPAGFPNATYGFSYVYYAGTADPLDFTVRFYGTLDGTAYPLSSPKTFTQKYTLKNINVWDNEDAPMPQIVQTVVKTGLEFKNASAITVPTTGSRFTSLPLPATKSLGKHLPVVFK